MHWSCRFVQEEKVSLRPVVFTLDHTVVQPQAMQTQQVTEGPSTPFLATTLPSEVWVMAQNTTVLSTCRKAYIQIHNQEVSWLQMGHHVSTALHDTHEQYSSFLPVFHHTSSLGICDC